MPDYFSRHICGFGRARFGSDASGDLGGSFSALPLGLVGGARRPLGGHSKWRAYGTTGVARNGPRESWNHEGDEVEEQTEAEVLETYEDVDYDDRSAPKTVQDIKKDSTAAEAEVTAAVNQWENLPDWVQKYIPA